VQEFFTQYAQLIASTFDGFRLLQTLPVRLKVGNFCSKKTSKNVNPYVDMFM